MPYFLDVWSLGHIALWGALGFFMMTELHSGALGTGSHTRHNLIACLTLGLMIGVNWELIEWCIVEPLMHFHEPWYNRWISDPCCDLLGTLIGAVIAIDVQDRYIRRR